MAEIAMVKEGIALVGECRVASRVAQSSFLSLRGRYGKDGVLSHDNKQRLYLPMRPLFKET